MGRFVDLHVHTNCSDGLLSPAELLERVRSKNLAAFAVCDHDTIEGYRQVRQLLNEDDPELITGVELSVMINGADLHMLAYDFDPEHDEFKASMELFRHKRNERGKMIVAKLREQGVSMSYDRVEEVANGAVVGRPHIAQALFESGVTKRYEEAFYRYIGYDSPAYVPKSELTPREAIDLVHAAGGVAIMAHPMVADMHNHLEELLPLGLDGVEAYHYIHKRHETERLISFARENDLIYTGGSDFHGRNDRDADIGSQRVPISCLDQIRKRSTS